jgi:hypothetical protein
MKTPTAEQIHLIDYAFYLNALGAAYHAMEHVQEAVELSDQAENPLVAPYISTGADESTKFNDWTILLFFNLAHSALQHPGVVTNKTKWIAAVLTALQPPIVRFMPADKMACFQTLIDLCNNPEDVTNKTGREFLRELRALLETRLARTDDAPADEVRQVAAWVKSMLFDLDVRARVLSTKSR